MNFLQSDISKYFNKSPYKSVKHSTYFKSYEHFFAKYRNKEITFIEIGVLCGGSLFMWRKYFGPKARIIGIDLNPNAKKWEQHGFEIFIGNQSDKNFWKNITKKIDSIDIVLDDGGHTYEQQIITVECLFDTLNDGGIIVVEDTHSSYMNGFGPKKFSFINYVKNKIDQVNYRFNFEGKKYIEERRFWSIEIVESMVAFKINRVASNEISVPLINKGKDDELAADFRYENLHKLKQKFRFLKNIPFIRYFALVIVNYFLNIKFNAKKYFKK